MINVVHKPYTPVLIRYPPMRPNRIPLPQLEGDRVQPCCQAHVQSAPVRPLKFAPAISQAPTPGSKLLLNSPTLTIEYTPFPYSGPMTIEYTPFLTQVP